MALTKNDINAMALSLTEKKVLCDLWDLAASTTANGGDISPATVATSGNASVGGTLGVTGTTTLAAVAATTGTFSGAVKRSVADALTAHSGGTQAAALALTKDINRVTVCAADHDSVKLPAATAGLSIVVVNAQAVKILDVFPASGESINEAANDAVLSLATAGKAMFVCAVAGKWDAIVSA